MLSVYKEPLADLTNPVPKEDSVVEPLTPTWNNVAPVDEAMVKGIVDPLPCTNNVDVGLIVPTPILPFAFTVSNVAPVEDDKRKISLELAMPWTWSEATGVVVLIPMAWF